MPHTTPEARGTFLAPLEAMASNPVESADLRVETRRGEEAQALIEAFDLAGRGKGSVAP